MPIKAWILVGGLAVNLYLLGVMVLFATITYPQFGSVDRAAFPSLYSAFNSRIGAPVVLWEFVAFFATLALYARRPDSASVVMVHALTALGIAYFAITFGWHLPAHRPLAAGDNSVAQLAPLLASQWARTAVQLGRSGVLAWLSAAAIS
jgi:hypothetical protein